MKQYKDRDWIYKPQRQIYQTCPRTYRPEKINVNALCKGFLVRVTTILFQPKLKVRRGIIVIRREVIKYLPISEMVRNSKVITKNNQAGGRSRKKRLVINNNRDGSRVRKISRCFLSMGICTTYSVVVVREKTYIEKICRQERRVERVNFTVKNNLVGAKNNM